MSKAPESDFTVEVASDLSRVSPREWDALNTYATPFVEHAFLRLLETSGTVGEEAGWMPTHVLVRAKGELVGALPTYARTDSYGEFIWDFAWAQGAQRAGLAYYPKLTTAVPFTPATGPRLLAQPGPSRETVQGVLARALRQLCGELGASSAHVLFCTPDEADLLGRAGYMRRATHQYHWRNDGYGSFDDFLGNLRSEQRKQLKKERRRVLEQGVVCELRRGDEVSDEEWLTLGRLYRSTIERKWGGEYMSRRFFEEAKSAVGRDALIGFARRDGKIIAGTLSYERGAHVYGRYWGAFEYVDGLHFELCYYQLIDHAIATKKRLVEAGAQGEHKLKRGFVPVVTHSAHHIEDARLAAAVRRFIEDETRALDDALPALNAHTPFRRAPRKL